MKITKRRIKEIILEELTRMNEASFRVGGPKDPMVQAQSGYDSDKARDKWEKNADRPMPVQDGVSISTRHIEPVLKMLHRFLSENFETGPAGATADAFKRFFDANEDVYDELWAASKTVMVDRDKSPMAQAAHDKDLFADIIDIDNFHDYIDGGRVLRSIMKHIRK